VRALVEVADDHPLHDDADDHDEKRAAKDGGDERAGVVIRQPAGITAQHEHGAVRQIENAERAIDDRQSR